MLEKPIIILGAARSGTTMLARIVNKHPEVAYWNEPNYVWKTGNSRIGHDMIPATNITPEIKKQIRMKFKKFMTEQGKNRFCEKTPSNMLRLPLVMQVLPEAKVVHIIRDGRDVIISAKKKWRGEISDRKKERGVKSRDVIIKRLKEKLQKNIPSPRNIIYNSRKIIPMMLNYFGLKKSSIWGPVFPGLEKIYKEFSLLETCAFQWRFCIDSALNYVKSESEIDYFEIKYETFCENPQKNIKKIFDFCELDVPNNLPVYAESIKNGNYNKWQKELSPEQLKRVYNIIGGTLTDLNYKL